MDKITRLAIIDHAVRWANNMICEVVGNHASVLSDKRRKSLLEITRAINNFLEGCWEDSQAAINPPSK